LVQQKLQLNRGQVKVKFELGSSLIDVGETCPESANRLLITSGVQNCFRVFSSDSVQFSNSGFG